MAFASTTCFADWFGVYEVNQDLHSNADRSGFEIGMPRDSGVYVPIQIGYEPKLGVDRLPGHYVAGFGYDSSRFTRFSSDLPASAAPDAGNGSGNTQFWLLADQMLVRHGNSDQDGLIALGSFIRNDPDHSPYAQQYFAGLLDRGSGVRGPKTASDSCSPISR